MVAPVQIKSDLFSLLKEKGIASLIDALSHQEAVQLAEMYGAHNYHPLPVDIVKGEGSTVWDANGKSYIDCIGAYSAVSHGHLNPFVAQTIRDQMERITLTSRAMYCPELGLFLKVLCDYAGMDRACPMNTGAEAIETCIKLARKWGYAIKQIPENQAEIIVADGNFHGRTTTIVGFSTEENYKHQFGPFTPGFKVVPFGDIEALKAAITPNTCAVLFEPIQAEGGVIIPPIGYLANVRTLCSNSNTLLIWDEIQTGFGRTGKRFAWQWEDARPDLMAVGKALGGGMYPVSAAIGSNEVVGLFQPGDHGSTFGGNPLASAVGMASLAEMVTESYEVQAQEKGSFLMNAFNSIQSPLIQEVRGRGLLIGLEVVETSDANKLTEAFLKEGLLTKETRHHTFRFAPPITTPLSQLIEIASRTESALKSIS